MTLHLSPDGGLAKRVSQPEVSSAMQGLARTWPSTGNTLSAAGAAPIKVGIADDHEVVRRGLRQYLSDFDDMRVIAEVCNGREALEMVREHALDVVTLDLAMPGYGGLDVLSNLKIRAPQTGVLVPTSTKVVIQRRSSTRSGPSPVANGISPASSPICSPISSRGYPTTLPHQNLSDRQLQVFLRLARGHTIGEIATELCISVKSTHKLRLGVKRVLQAASNSDMTYYALKHRLTQ